MSTTTATGARIEIRGLTKRFGSFVAVDDLSFAVEPGRITGFLGPNGAGKTTTLRMLLGPGPLHQRHRHHRRPALRRPPDPAVHGRARPSRPPTSTPAAAAATTCGCSPTPARIPLSRVDELLELTGIPAAARKRAGEYSHGHAPAARPGRRPARRPAGARPRRALQRAGPRGHPLAARLPAPPQPRGQDDPGLQPPAPGGRADRRRGRHHRQRPPRARRARWPSCTARPASVVRTSDRERLAGALRVADVTSTPGDRRHRWSPTPPTCASSATSRCAPACRSTSCEPKRADLEALFFELTEGTNRNERRGGAPPEQDAVTGQEGANL